MGRRGQWWGGGDRDRKEGTVTGRKGQLWGGGHSD